LSGVLHRDGTSRPEVVITGLGLIHGLGLGADPLVAALAQAAPPQVASRDPIVECSHFEPEKHRESSKTYLDRCSDLALGASYLAVRDAGLNWQGGEHPRWGVSLGTAYGCLESMLNMSARVQQKGMRFGSPVIFTHSLVNSPAALVGIEYELQGPCMTHCVGDLSGAAALEYALTIMRMGRADLLLAGGVEALNRPLLAALDNADLERAPGEAAAVLVVETAEHAAARGASILAELAGAALLAQAAHGDALLAALEDARGETAEVIAAPPACGHTFGASLALDAAACVGLLAGGHAGPLAALSRDRRGAIVLRRWDGS